MLSQVKDAVVTLLKHQLVSFEDEKRAVSLTAGPASPPLQLAKLVQLNWQNLLRVHRYAHYVLLVEEFVASSRLEERRGEPDADREHALAQGELAGALLETLLLHGLLSEQNAVEGAALALCSRRANAIIRASALRDADAETGAAAAAAARTCSRALALYPQRDALLVRLHQLCAQLNHLRFIDELTCEQQASSALPVRVARQTRSSAQCQCCSLVSRVARRDAREAHTRRRREVPVRQLAAARRARAHRADRRGGREALRARRAALHAAADGARRLEPRARPARDRRRRRAVCEHIAIARALRRPAASARAGRLVLRSATSHSGSRRANEREAGAAGGRDRRARRRRRRHAGVAATAAGDGLSGRAAGGAPALACAAPAAESRAQHPHGYGYGCWCGCGPRGAEEKRSLGRRAIRGECGERAARAHVLGAGERQRQRLQSRAVERAAVGAERRVEHAAARYCSVLSACCSE